MPSKNKKGTRWPSIRTSRMPTILNMDWNPYEMNGMLFARFYQKIQSSAREILAPIAGAIPMQDLALDNVKIWFPSCQQQSAQGRRQSRKAYLVTLAIRNDHHGERKSHFLLCDSVRKLPYLLRKILYCYTPHPASLRSDPCAFRQDVLQSFWFYLPSDSLKTVPPLWERFTTRHPANHCPEQMFI